MPKITLSAGTIDYTDTGGSGPVLVLLHGVLMNAAVWRKVVEELGNDYRCVVPTLPLGAHRQPMRPDADLTIHGMARLVGEFIEALDLHEVTLVMNDWGGAQLLVVEQRDDRIARMALVACEAFDNFPPGLTGKVLGVAAKWRFSFDLLVQPFRYRTVRHAPGSFGSMSRCWIPDVVMDGWFDPMLENPDIRRDLRAYCRSIPDRATQWEWSRELARFDRPALVAWAADDQLMPRWHGPRLAALLPDAEYVEFTESRTLIPEDEPEKLATQLELLVRRESTSSAAG